MYQYDDGVSGTRVPATGPLTDAEATDLLAEWDPMLRTPLIAAYTRYRRAGLTPLGAWRFATSCSLRPPMRALHEEIWYPDGDDRVLAWR